MKKKVYNFGKNFKEFPYLQMSFHTRYTALECLFGDPKEEEPNIAYSILKSLKKVR
jgi:hypothetical protein